jgi:glycosyltransferase involved in cell wall biosynthesis
MSKVVILQEYIPAYRVPFFKRLRDEGIKNGIDIFVAYGKAGSSLAQRHDTASLGPGGIRIHQWEMKLAGRRVVVRRTAKALKGADLVILEQARRNVDAYRILPSRRSNDQLVAMWGHGKDYTRKTTAVDRKLARWLTLKADWFFAYTLGGRDHVVADGFPASRVSVVQNSIDSNGLRESLRDVLPVELMEFSKAHNLLGSTALFMGALDSSKRLPFLFEAALRVHKLDPDFRLLIAGDGELRPVVEEWAQANTWVSYLGSLSGKMKAIALGASQVLAVPGRVGLIAVDSFAAEVPIITTGWEWHAPEFEYLVDGYNAVVTTDDPGAFGDALLDVLGDDELLSTLRGGTRESGSVFTVEAMADNFLHGIRAALATRPL